MNIDELRNRPTISLAEVAEVFGIARSTAYRYAEGGEILIERRDGPVVLEVWRIGGRVCVPTPPLLRALGVDTESAPPDEHPNELGDEASEETRPLQAVEDSGDRVA